MDKPSGWKIMKAKEIAIQYLNAVPPDQTDDITDVQALLEKLKDEGADLGGIVEALCLYGEGAEREAEVIKQYRDELKVRQQRKLKEHDACGNAVMQMMQEFPEAFPPPRKSKALAVFHSPLVDARVQRGRETARVTDEKKIPDRFWIKREPELDKKALNEAVCTDGEVIEGAEISNGAPYLVVKT